MLAKFIQPLAIFLIMFGMGMTLVWDDFRRVLMYPLSITIGILLKVLILPLMMFALLQWIPLDPQLAVGFMLLAALPGGAFSNLVSLLARGNVALSITLTAMASFITAFSIPIILDISLESFLNASQRIPFDALSALRDILLMTILPVSLGMLLRKRSPQFADKAEKPFIYISAASLSLILGIALLMQWEKISETFAICGTLAIAVNLVVAGTGFLATKLAGVNFKQSLTVGIEVSVINTVLGIAIASNTLDRPEIGIPATIYSVAMAPAIIIAIFWGRSRSEEATSESGESAG